MLTRIFALGYGFPQSSQGLGVPFGARSSIRLGGVSSPNEAEALVAAYQAGMTMKELGAAFGVHRNTVSEHLRQRGVRIRGRGLDEDDIDEAARLYQAGWSSLRLGEKFGVSPDTVLTALRKTGVGIRPGQGGRRRLNGRGEHC